MLSPLRQFYYRRELLKKLAAGEKKWRAAVRPANERLLIESRSAT
jgi:hypothetical protein